MSPGDGRVVSNFVMQAIKGEPLTIYGEGQQTRSFQYVHDLVDGLILLMNKPYQQPVNLGNPDEYTIKDFADIICQEVLTPPLSADNVQIKQFPEAKDDPKKRKPDIERAKTHLGWEPRISVRQGLKETVEWFKRQVADGVI